LEEVMVVSLSLGLGGCESRDGISRHRLSHTGRRFDLCCAVMESLQQEEKEKKRKRKREKRREWKFKTRPPL
jgi:hypothetical protein